MRTLRAVSTLLFSSALAAAGVAACASKSDTSLGDGGKSGGGSGGASSIPVSGGASGSGTTGGTGGSSSGTGGSSSGGTDSGTAGDDGVAECGDLGGLGKCGGTHLEAELRTVNMLLVIDKSGSMDDKPDGFAQKKWPAMRSAIATALAKVETQMNFGLILYPYSVTQTIPLDGCDSNCCSVAEDSGAVRVDVRPGTISVDQINTELTLADPGGGTPTAAALAAALDYFKNGDGASLKGANYVLLATDGGPNCNEEITCGAATCTTNLDGSCDSGNCCEDADPPILCLDDKAVLAQLDLLKAEGISTFVVGIPGTEAYSSYLDEFAEAGGVPASGGEHQYYAVSADQGVEGLVDVFDTITTQLVHACEISLPEPPSKLDLVNVAVDCDVIPQNEDSAKSGWDFDARPEPSSVILHGPVCDALQVNGAERIDVVFGCPTVR